MRPAITQLIVENPTTPSVLPSYIMGVLAPPPTVLGVASLTFVVELFCAIHLCVCIAVICSADSVQSAKWGGVEVSPLMRCINAAWFLLGIPVIIHASIGVLYRVESHVKVYILYLVGTWIAIAVWTMVFMSFGSTCEPAGLNEAVLVCGITNGISIFWMLVVLVLVSVMVFLVWTTYDYIHERHETELLRLQEPWKMISRMAEDSKAGEIRQMVEAQVHLNTAMAATITHSSTTTTSESDSTEDSSTSESQDSSEITTSTEESEV